MWGSNIQEAVPEVVPAAYADDTYMVVDDPAPLQQALDRTSTFVELTGHSWPSG